MLVSVAKLKEYMGLPEADDPAIDPVVDRSLKTTHALISGYLGYSVEQDEESPLVLNETNLEIKVYRLDACPASVTSVIVDGVTLTEGSDYLVNTRLGTIEFQHSRCIGEMQVTWSAGFTVDTLPADLNTAIVNIATGIYDNGGKLSAAGSTGDLKSLTMFDAMSMSFDVGASTASASTPEGIVSQWAFILDKYRASGKYVMGR